MTYSSHKMCMNTYCFSAQSAIPLVTPFSPGAPQKNFVLSVKFVTGRNDETKIPQ